MRDGRYAGNVLLALDPDVYRLYVCARSDVVLGQDGLLDPVDLRDDVELPRVAPQDLAAVFKFVLRVPAAAQADGCDDAVGDGAGAGVDVHREQRDRCSVVGREADELWSH